MTGFYPRLRDKRQDDDDLQDCIETVVNKLEQTQTSEDKPGMLLGKIQSGKTRGFLGVIAKAFDRDYDIALVFTKGTKTLATQTVRRISRDFSDFIDNEEVAVFDIMQMPERLTRSERRRKLIFVAKKEVNNLKRVNQLFTNPDYPEFKGRRVLLIDDEADMASVRFVQKQATGDFEQGAIAQQMDNLRSLVDRIAFLQVTATPYALYLQPDEYPVQGPNAFLFLPKRPAFTALLPIHGAYVGGDDYFGDFDESDSRHYLFVPVPLFEQDALRSEDGRTIREDRIWVSANIEVLRRAVMTFLVAVAVRRWQQAAEEQRGHGKFAMIIHNDTQRSAHKWQWDTVERLRLAFEGAAEGDDTPLRRVFEPAYEDISRSVLAHGGRMPDGTTVFEAVKELILDGELNVQRVNSDVEVAPLLDPDTAELKLRTRANVFIGGSLLDRGITIPSLIAFYYGRNPTRMQADTVLQHSRMYGARDRRDLAVTRFYTSAAVFQRLSRINDLEAALRDAFERGGHEAGVVFLQNDAGKGIIPCAPNKVALSSVVTVRPAGFYLPTDFDTAASKAAASSLQRLDAELIERAGRDTSGFVTIPLEQAIELVSLSKGAIALPKDGSFYWEAMEGLLRYYAQMSESKNVRLLVEKDRRLSKAQSGGKSGQSIVGGVAIRALLSAGGRSEPALVMLRQDGGRRQLGWSGNQDFWWPVLAAPTTGAPCVFSNP
jgi:hypothetical protein